MEVWSCRKKKTVLVSVHMLGMNHSSDMTFPSEKKKEGENTRKEKNENKNRRVSRVSWWGQTIAQCGWRSQWRSRRVLWHGKSDINCYPSINCFSLGCLIEWISIWYESNREKFFFLQPTTADIYRASADCLVSFFFQFKRQRHVVGTR